jgi:ornithine carbamoyltransferase
MCEVAGVTGPRHFIDLDQVDQAELRNILDDARRRKDARAGLPKGTADADRPLAGRILAMIFDKPSTRTRVSFEVAMRQLGGEALLLQSGTTQIGRGETMADTARVLSRYVDAIMIRTTGADRLAELVEHATVPVINGLTDDSHPCQIMADVMTYEEHRGSIGGKVVAWSGDGNNVARSWIHASARFGFELRLACPEPQRPSAQAVAWAQGQGARVSVVDDPAVAARDADCIVTDCWVSMGEQEDSNRHNLMRPYQVDERLMALAKPDALFMHCLPAHRGEEVTAGVIDGPQSVVFDEAENRLHAQKSVLTWCLAR